MARRSSIIPAAILFLVVALAAGGTFWVLMTPPPTEAVQPGNNVALGGKAVPTAKEERPAAAAKTAPTAPVAAPAPAPAPVPAPSPPPAMPMEQPAPVAAAITKPPPAAPPLPAPEQKKPVPVTPSIPDPVDAPIENNPEGDQKAAPALSPPAPKPPAAIAKIAPPIKPKIPRLPKKKKELPLPVASDPSLVEQGPAGPLPVVSRDGREAWRVYARPFKLAKKQPVISLVLYGLGPSSTATRAAIQGLPGAVTLAFSPYADNLTAWIAEARAAGHETLMMVPMEPTNYPQFDPGPKALLTTLESTENTARLEWVLGRAKGYVGITNFMGSRFTNSPPHLTRLMETLKKRGLLYLESRPVARAQIAEIAGEMKVPFAGNTMYIDSRASREAIDGQLREAERRAWAGGRVVIMGYAYPVTLERTARWTAEVIKRGIALAPVSAMSIRKGR